jgi:tetratricopeptide (TPR) repeat protein
MAKKQNSKPAQAAKSAPATPIPYTTPAGSVTGNVPDDGNAGKRPLSLYDFKVQAIIISVIAFILNFNTFFNEYAHDDGIVIVKNEYVQEGFAGIPNILTKDAYDSYYRQLNTINQLSGGRYRPLSIVTFAIEQQFLGPVSQSKIDSVLKQNIAYGVHGEQQVKLIRDMHVRHVFNVLWFILSIIVLLYFFRYIVFKNEPVMAFIAAIIFTVHPIHTEVIANVKSRDEIMSLLFMCTTFIYTFKYYEFKKKWMLAAALVSYFLAFLSKEYAITMVALLPLSLYLFNGFSIKKSIFAFGPFLLVIAAYLALRFNIVAPMGENSDSEVLNNPYYFASNTEKLATEIATCLNYLRLLILPNTLSADYSYNSIPYVDFSNLKVWLSILVYGAMTVAMFVLFPFRNAKNTFQSNKYRYHAILCFAIAFYLFHFLLVCNVVFDIGATMGERLIYHSSVGFAIALAFFIYKGFEKIKPVAVSRKALAGFMVIIIILAGYKTIARNADWKNDATLFSADLKTVPNSVLVLGNVAAADITESDFQKDEETRKQYLYNAITLLDHALTIHHTFVAGFLNRSIAWYKLGEVDKAKPNLDTVRKLYPTYPTLPGMYKLLSEFYMKNGWEKYGRYGKYPEAINEFKKGLAIDSTNPELWYNLGGALFSERQYPDAINAWKVALKLKPGYMQAQQGLQAGMEALNATGRPPVNNNSNTENKPAQPPAGRKK